MRSQIVDAILSIWAPGEECLTYSQIKQRSVSKGLINKTNDRSLSRWLGNLVEDGMLRKTQNGYFLETKPKVYQVFDYLSQLRQKYPKYIYEGEVGGWISHVCALTYLNFDETLMQKFDERLAFEIISTRIGHLFGALYTLKNDVLKRRCGLSQLRLNDEVVREALFGLLNKSIGENHETEELVGKYLRYLGKIEQKMFDQIWAQNKSKGDFDYADYLGQDFFVENIEEDPQGYKKFLKKESLNIEKYSIDELINKYIKIQQSIELKHKPENPKEEYGYALTEEEAELENNYRTAILTKVAEGIKALETNTEDFAIILTRHPATMNQYFTPEHILYEAMKWAASPPEEDLLKEMWQEIHEEEKTFEAMVAERLAQYNSLTKEKVEALRSKPWVKNELSKLGNFDEILRLYAEKRNKYLRERKKQVKSFFERFDKGLENLEDTKTK